MPRFLPLVLLLGACASERSAPEPMPAEPGLYGPANSWFHADADAVPVTPEERIGFAQGEIAPDIWMPDQFGDMVALHQFHGKAVLLDIMRETGTRIETPIEGEECES